MVQELCELLINGNADVKDVIKRCVLNQPFKLICQRLLHHMDDSSLLDFLNGVLGRSYSQRQLQRLALTGAASSVEAAAWACQQLENFLQLLIFGCVKWQQLDELSLHVAMAFQFQQLQRGLQATDKLEVIYLLLVTLADNTVCALCTTVLFVASVCLLALVAFCCACWSQRLTFLSKLKPYLSPGLTPHGSVAVATCTELLS